MKCKKVLETQEVLRNAIRKSCSITLLPRLFFLHCSQSSLFRDNYFYGVYRYFVILSIDKFYDIVIY